MTIPPLTSTELQDQYGVHPNITTRIVHLLRQEKLPEDPRILRGVLALYSKNGLGLELNKAYTLYFLLVAVRGTGVGSPGLSNPRLLGPTIEYGKALVRAGVHQEPFAWSVGEVGAFARDALDVDALHEAATGRTGGMVETGLVASMTEQGDGEALSQRDMERCGSAVNTRAEPAPASFGAVKMAAVSGVVDLSLGGAATAVPDVMPSVHASGTESDRTSQTPEILGWSGVETTEDHGDPSVFTTDLTAEKNGTLLTENRGQTLEVISKVGAFDTVMNAGNALEDLTSWPSSEGRESLTVGADGGAERMLAEVGSPSELLASEGAMSLDTVDDGEADDSHVMTPDSGPTPALPADEPGVEMMEVQGGESALLAREGERVRSEMPLVEVSQTRLGGLVVVEADERLAGESPESGEGSVKPGGSEQDRWEAAGKADGGGGPEWPGEEPQRTLVFPTQVAASVESPALEPWGVTSEPTLSRMAEQLGGAFRKMPFSVAGVPSLESSEGQHGPGEVADGGSSVGNVGVSRVPLWDVEDRQAHPAEASGYAQMFPDLEGLTAAVEAMQPHFTFLGELDAYYLQYPEQKGKRSLDDVRVIGDATRSLLESLGLLSAPDADLFAPEFEKADGALVRLLGSY